MPPKHPFRIIILDTEGKTSLPVFLGTEYEVGEKDCDCSGRETDDARRQGEESKCVVGARGEETRKDKV